MINFILKFEITSKHLVYTILMISTVTFPYFCLIASIFPDFGYDWYFMRSLLEFQRK